MEAPSLGTKGQQCGMQNPMPDLLNHELQEWAQQSGFFTSPRGFWCTLESENCWCVWTLEPEGLGWIPGSAIHWL